MRVRLLSRWFSFFILFLLSLAWIFAESLAWTFPGQSSHVQSQSNAQSQSLEQQGRRLYEIGQYQAAVSILQQAIQQYDQQGDRLRQAIAWSNLALTYQQLGWWQSANQAIEAAQRQVIEQPVAHQPALQKISVQAQVLDIQGRLQFLQGQPAPALESWEQAALLYQQQANTLTSSQNAERHDNTDRLLRNQINQSRALQALGLSQQAKQRLEQLNATLQNQPNSLLKVFGLRSLGDALRAIGALTDSHQALVTSLSIARQLQTTSADLPASQLIEAIALVQLSLGNTAAAQDDRAAALRYYSEAIDTIGSEITSAETTGIILTRLQAQINRFSLLIDAQQWSTAQLLIPLIQQQLATLPLGQPLLYAKVHFAEGMLKAVKQKLTDESLLLATAQLLATVERDAQQLGDQRSRSYATGRLGEVYEQKQQWSEAEQLTRQALQGAETVQAAEMLYLWEWQLGRILRAQAAQDIDPQTRIEAAVAAYESAISTAETLRIDLVSVDSEIQFTFREKVEPMYRELITLLLEQFPTIDVMQQITAPEPIRQKNLARSIEAFRGLQFAELQNFFGCLDIFASTSRNSTISSANSARSQNLEDSRQGLAQRQKQNLAIPSGTAILYPILLNNQLSVLVKLPQQPLIYYSTPLAQTEIQEQIQILRSQLTDTSASPKVLAGKFYDWLIRPVHPLLQQQNIKNLIFLLDSDLKNLPMAALYDGQRYLVEQYSIALFPGFQLPRLADSSPPLDRQAVRLLFAGVSQGVDRFAQLPFIEREAAAIAAIVPKTTKLLNQAFTVAALQTKIQSNPFQIIHLATHGQFSSRQEDTFILTLKEKINVEAFDRLLRSTRQTQLDPIELLVLSACQTATGDRRAALGLTGVAARAGAKNTLGTLWSVDDEVAAEIMVKFYQSLTSRPNRSIAEALQMAQKDIISHPYYSHPKYWAPYVILGHLEDSI